MHIPPFLRLFLSYQHFFTDACDAFKKCTFASKQPCSSRTKWRGWETRIFFSCFLASVFCNVLGKQRSLNTKKPCHHQRSKNVFISCITARKQMLDCLNRLRIFKKQQQSTSTTSKVQIRVSSKRAPLIIQGQLCRATCFVVVELQGVRGKATLSCIYLRRHWLCSKWHCACMSACVSAPLPDSLSSINRK